MSDATDRQRAEGAAIEQLTYTDVPRGRGLDPALSGFQVAAASAGLGPGDRELLGAVCRHYGDAVYRSASAEALDREGAWRATADDLSAVPDDVLALFPVAWSYDALGDDRFALTRVRYAGPTHDGRFGNFFARSLVFRPAALARCDYNPLALARSGMFDGEDARATWASPGAAAQPVSTPGAADEGSVPHASVAGPSGATSLPAIDAAALVAPPAHAAALLEAPFREYVEDMISALCAAPSRPVLVRLADWHVGPALVEALLGALPPAGRCRTTFATFENDRRWSVSGSGIRSGNAPAAHELFVMSGRAGADLRPDEYRSAYSVFNFADERFGELPAPRPYALLAGRYVRAGDAPMLARYHAALGALDFGDSPEAWDALVESFGGPGAPEPSDGERPRRDAGAGVGPDSATPGDAAEARAGAARGDGPDGDALDDPLACMGAALGPFGTTLARVAKTPAQAERALDVLTARLANVAETARLARAAEAAHGAPSAGVARSADAPGTERPAAVAGTATVALEPAGAPTDDWAALVPLASALAPSLAALAGRAESTTPWEGRLRALAAASAAAGRGSLAERLVSACGPRRPDVLVGSLAASSQAIRALPAVPPPEARARLAPAERDALAIVLRDRERLADLCFEGAAVALDAGDAETSETLVEAGFAAAAGASALADAWERHGSRAVAARLDGAWDERRAAFARRLSIALAPDACPEGAAWLATRTIEAGTLAGRDLADALAVLARAAGGCAAGKKVADAAMGAAEKAFRGPDLAVALARLAAEARGGLFAERFFDRYADSIAALPEAARFDVRRAAAEAGAGAAPAREMLDAVAPWDADTFDAWWRAWVGSAPGAFAGLCDALAESLAEPARASAGDAALLCAIATLGRPAPALGPDPAPEHRARARLLDAVALAIPMRPLSPADEELFGEDRASLGEAAALRLDVMELLGEVERAGGEARWSAGALLERFGADEWPRAVRALRRDDKRAALAVFRATFDGKGIETPEDAEGWVLFMEAAGEATVDEIVEAVARALDGRDPVTCVVAAAAFARCALEGSRIEGAWVELLRDLLAAFDKETRRAFERHMALRFGSGDADYERRLAALAREARFAAPSDLGSAARSGVTVRPPADKAQPTGLFGTSKRFFGRK